MTDNQEPGFDLVMPFVVCASKGGPYDDQAFVAGYDCGGLNGEMRVLAMLGVTEHTWDVARPAALAPQIDLIAMHHGFVATFTPWDRDENEGPEFDFVTVSIRRCETLA